MRRILALAVSLLLIFNILQIGHVSVRAESEDAFADMAVGEEYIAPLLFFWLTRKAN
jgi:hypothetical protein